MNRLITNPPRVSRKDEDRLKLAISNHHKVRAFVKTASLDDICKALTIEGSRADGRVRLDVLKTLITAMQEREKTLILEALLKR